MNVHQLARAAFLVALIFVSVSMAFPTAQFDDDQQQAVEMTRTRRGWGDVLRGLGKIGCSLFGCGRRKRQAPQAETAAKIDALVGDATKSVANETAAKVADFDKLSEDEQRKKLVETAAAKGEAEKKKVQEALDKVDAAVEQGMADVADKSNASSEGKEAQKQVFATLTDDKLKPEEKVEKIKQQIAAMPAKLKEELHPVEDKAKIIEQVKKISNMAAYLDPKKDVDTASKKI